MSSVRPLTNGPGVYRAKISRYDFETATRNLWVYTRPDLKAAQLRTIIQGSGCRVLSIRKVLTGKDVTEERGSWDSESWNKKITDEYIFQMEGKWINCYGNGRLCELKPIGMDGKGFESKETHRDRPPEDEGILGALSRGADGVNQDDDDGSSTIKPIRREADVQSVIEFGRLQDVGGHYKAEEENRKLRVRNV
jgi:hypothetical protein